MPTKCDFYVGEGNGSEWLGSVPWDGYPDGVNTSIFESTTEFEYRNAVSVFLTNLEGSVLPEQGWPWAWSSSRTTDYAYTWLDGRVWGSSFGDWWFLIQPELEDFGELSEDGADADNVVVRGMPDFPDMKSRQSVRHDQGSGYIALSIPGQRTNLKG